ncbi:hypothetical protein VTI74DRAFT_383 [Chaetomium olivicolor]
MRSFLASALLALAAHVAAIKITSPSKNDVVDPSAGVTVKWSTVSTDPAKAHLVLVNMAAGHTPYTKDLGEIDLSKGSIVITEKNVPADSGYQFNFQSVDPQNTGILAQSEQFEVKASGDSDDKTKTTVVVSTFSGKTAESTKTAASSDEANAATTSAATTLTTVSTTGTATTKPTGTATQSASTTASTGAAATAMAVQGGGLIALVAGVAAFMA